jgi:hypothetical protein
LLPLTGFFSALFCEWESFANFRQRPSGCGEGVFHEIGVEIIKLML